MTKRPGLRLACAAALLTSAAAAARADFVYSRDDGVAEHLLGFDTSATAADVLWISRFDAVPGGTLIEAVQFTIGRFGPSPPQPTTVVAVLYEDPNDDGNPDDAVLVAFTFATVQNPNTGIFQTVSFTPTTVSGQFFVGLAAQLPQTPGPFYFPLSIDGDKGVALPHGNDFFIATPAGGINFSAPSGFTDLIDAPINGQFMIRAIANPEPAASALFALGFAGLGAIAWRRRRGAATSRG